MFAISIVSGSAELMPGPLTGTSRAYDVLEGMKRIAHLLPDMQIPFTIADGPGVAVSGEEKELHYRAAGEGRQLTEEEFEGLGKLVDPSFGALTETLCPPNSPVRNALSGTYTGRPLAQGPSFVGLDHLTAMDLCQHPEHRWQHGQTIVDGIARGELYPLIASSKTGMHSDILTTPMEQYYTPLGSDPAWGEKKENQVVWRGSTTGSWHGVNIHLWRGAHRPRLVEMANGQRGERSVVWAQEEEGDRMRVQTVREAEANKDWFDVAYVGFPLQVSARVPTLAPGWATSDRGGRAQELTSAL